MPKMNHHFATAFSKESPEAYQEVLRERKTRRTVDYTDAATAIYVPLFSPLVTRFLASLVVLTVLLGGYFLFLQDSFSYKELSIPSGQVMSESQGSPEVTVAKSLSALSNSQNDLASKLKPMGESSQRALGR